MDLISRQAAIDAFAPYAEYESNRTNAEWVRRINMVLSALPPAQPVEDIHREKEQAYYCGYEDGAKAARSAQPGWIPFGAPMNSGQHYLVTLRQKFEGEETYRVRIMRLHEGHWLYPHHFPEWINDEMEQEVVAWMPLPKPWEGK